MESKSMILKKFKFYDINLLISGLEVNNYEPKVEYNRREIQLKKDSNLVDNYGEWTIFGKTMTKLQNSSFNSLKINNPNKKAWKAVFVGEGSEDAGGPYREALTNLISELYTPCLPLLVPTQNQKNDHGFGRDLWTLNPSSDSPTHLEMYKFLGALMGMAFRANHVIDIKFPSIVWKQIIGDTVTMEDLEQTD